MYLTRFEQETIVNFNEESSRAEVYTYNKPLVRKLRLLSEKFPQDVVCVAEEDDGSITYRIPKQWIRINAPRQITEEQRAAMAERLRKAIKVQE